MTARLVGAVAILLACTSSSPKREAVGIRSVAVGPVEPEWTLTGRVTLDGRPVTHYGIAVGVQTFTDLFDRGRSPLVDDSLVIVRRADGRFAIPIQPGTWDIVVAGVGFARYVVRDVVIETTGQHAPLEIELELGSVIEGTVWNPSGAPMAGAVVEIQQSGYLATTMPKFPDAEHRAFWQLAHGNFRATTDAAGKFRIADFVALAGSAELSAVAFPRYASLPLRITSQHTVLDVRLSEIGDLTGHVLEAPPSKGIVVIARPVRSPDVLLETTADERGVFHLEVPTGDYELGVRTSDVSAWTIVGNATVAAGRPANVTLMWK